MTSNYTQVIVHDHLGNFKETRTYKGSIELGCLKTVKFADIMGQVHEIDDYKGLDYAEQHDYNGIYMYKVTELPHCPSKYAPLCVADWCSVGERNCDQVVLNSGEKCTDYYAYQMATPHFSEKGYKCTTNTGETTDLGECQREANSDCKVVKQPPLPPPPIGERCKLNYKKEDCENWGCKWCGLSFGNHGCQYHKQCLLPPCSGGSLYECLKQCHSDSGSERDYCENHCFKTCPTPVPTPTSPTPASPR